MTIRSPLILAAVASALALGACGGSDGGGGSSGSKSPQDKAFEGALKFSKCMRDHGVDMPDPQRVGTGGIKLSGGKINPNDPKTKAAQQACAKYMKVGGGQTVDPARRAQLQQAALDYARCMRAQGVDMPDPQISSDGGATFKFQAGAKNGSSDSSSGPKGPAVNPDSPKFKAADKVCHGKLGDLAPGAGTSQEKAG